MARAASAINQAVGTAETETGGCWLRPLIRYPSDVTPEAPAAFEMVLMASVRQSGAAAQP